MFLIGIWADGYIPITQSIPSGKRLQFAIENGHL